MSSTSTTRPRRSNQPPPFTIKAELHYGCNLACAFCGTRSLPSGHHDLTPDAAHRIARNLATLSDHPRVEFAGRGEPTLNGDWLECIAIFRHYLPKAQLMVTSNGLPLSRQWRAWLHLAAAAGLNVLIVDLYDPHAPTLRELIERETPRGWSVDPDGFRPFAYNGHRGNVVVLFDDIVRAPSRLHHVSNQAGNSPARPALREPLAKVCVHPFRELVVRWDGAVPLCCDDYGDEYHVGNLLEDKAIDLWWGTEMMAARRLLYARRRNLAPCRRCDEGSGTRVGLLAPQALPTPADEALVRAVNQRSPRTNGALL